MKRTIEEGIGLRTIAALCLLAAILISAAISMRIALSHHRPELARLWPDLHAATTDWAFPSRCPRVPGTKSLTGCQLPTSASTKDASILVLGDSISQVIYGRWAFAANSSDMPTMAFVSFGGCMFMPDVKRLEPKFACPQYVDEALNFAEAGGFKKVVIASLWSGYFAEGMHDICFIQGAKCKQLSGSERQAALVQSMDILTKRLARIRDTGKAVTIVLTMPYSSYDVPHELAKRLYLSWDLQPVVVIDRNKFEAEDAFFREHLKAVAVAVGADVIDPVPDMCDAVDCPTVTNGLRSLYRDSVHIRASAIRGEEFSFLDQVRQTSSEPSAANR